MFRIELTDKNGTPFSIDKPEYFLSNKAIDRRNNQKLEIDSTDLPISPKYEMQIKKLGFKPIAKSKWFNTITVECADSSYIEILKEVSFVNGITWVGKTIERVPVKNEDSKKIKSFPEKKDISYYGYAKNQIHTINGQKLHEKGYKGKGIDIAVIDGGYTNLKENLFLSTVNIGGYKDFVNNGTNMFSGDDHGISVLSMMATNQPNTFVGTAPEATYWLFRSENKAYEYPVEQDFWVSAIEYADSLGIDIVNTSLGYQYFDPPAKSITYEEMDGKTNFISRAAEKGTEKGMFLVVSAGNEGNKEWGKITAPSDAEHTLSVGSMTKDSIRSKFSSIGPTYDQRLKPDILAMGENVNLIDGSGSIVIGNGTSFSAPIVTGMAACLWQAFPKLTNIELLNIIRDSGNKKDSPSERFGYGIPNMLLAYKIAGDITTGIEEDIPKEVESNYLFSYKSDSVGHLIITKLDHNYQDKYELRIYNLSGRLIYSDTITTNTSNCYINGSVKQPYIVYMIGKDKTETKKILF